MHKFAIFSFLLLPTLMVGQNRHQSDWRRVNMVIEESQPQRSVAATVPNHIPDPGYSNIRVNRDAISRTNAPFKIEADFWGEIISFRTEQIPELKLTGNLTQERLSRAYRTLCSQQTPVLLADLKQQADHHRLNDWGYLQLVHSLTGTIYANDPAARILATAWLMQKSGYQATVSYSNSQIYLLVPVKQRLYGYTFLNVSGSRMYVVDPLGSAPQVSTAFLFEPAESKQGRAIDMSIKEAPRLIGSMMQRQVQFKYKGTQYRGTIEVNKRVASFYRKYPLVDWSVYVAAPLSAEALASLGALLREPLQSIQPRAGWTLKMEQANFLLHFVQSAFPYRSDREALGEEHYAFAEEMLALPYSDCEDRSSLYLTLVREFLGLEAVGLLFPGHAAVGVKFSKQVNTDSVILNDTRYAVCDPSYIGADIGMGLPQLKGSRLKIVGK
ncbi:MAG: hypothetical protein NWR72_09800 [Bacteroidia bacterium]|nr:hypothetical protein [Bacteroidia bacterium]